MRLSPSQASGVFRIGPGDTTPLAFRSGASTEGSVARRSDSPSIPFTDRQGQQGRRRVGRMSMRLTQCLAHFASACMGRAALLGLGASSSRTTHTGPSIVLKAWRQAD